MFFYDGPRLDTNGFRRRMSEWSERRPQVTELILAVAWSAIIATFAFLVPLATRVAVSHELTTGDAIVSFVKRVALCTALALTAVATMLMAAPLREPFLTARGVAAGLFLRLGLFFGLVLVLV